MAKRKQNPQPRYPVYIPTLGRADNFLTAKMFMKDDVEFQIVVQPDQVEAYEPVVGMDRILVLPENGKGLVYARNWIKDHAVASGAERHWQFDDDIRYMERLYKGYRIQMSSAIALAAAEDFVDRYENVALASFNSSFFIVANGTTITQWPPFYKNARCYTAFLMMNSIPNRWRFKYNEDTDMTLQVIADGWCTILFNAFLIKTLPTQVASQHRPGGQTDVYINDGRLKMARDLERLWPGVVDTRRRFGRPQHRVKNWWRSFDNELILKKGVKIPKEPNNYGMVLAEKKTVRSKELQELVKESKGGK